MSTTNKKYFLLISAIATVIFLIVGIVIIGELKSYRIEESKREITTIAKTKISYLSYWYQDEVKDAQTIASNPALLERIYNWNSEKSLRNEISVISFLDQIKAEHDYKNISIVSNQGKVLLPDTYLLPQDTIFHNSILKASYSNFVISTNLFYSESNYKSHILFISPINDSNQLLLFEFDADKVVFEPITDWVASAKTGEIYLLQIEKDSITVISNPRSLKVADLRFKYSIIDTNSVAVKAALGFTGIVEGVDYKGKNVIAYVDKIKGPNWLFVAQIDVNEILGVYKLEAVLFVVSFFLLVSLLWVSFALFFNYRQKSLYKSLWESQEEFKTTLYSIGDAVITTDVEGKIKYLNKIAEELTGWEEAKASGKFLTDVFNIINEVTRQKVQNPVNKVLESGMIVGLSNHTILISKNGKEIPIADSGAPIKDKNGIVYGVVLVFRDQSKERESQKLLRQSEESYRGIFNGLKEAIFLEDENGVILDLNDSAAKMYGYEREFFIGRTREFLGAPGLNDYVKITEAVTKAFLGTPQHLEFWGIRKNREIFINDVRIFPGNFFDRKIVIVLAMDISERKKSEKELKERERAYSALISNLPGFVYRCANDNDWTIYFISNGCYSITGYHSNEFLLNKKIKFNDIIHPDHKDRVHKMWDEVIVERGFFESEYPIITKKGETRWIWERGQAIFSDDNTLLYLEGFITDVTDRKEALEQIENSEKKLRSILQAMPDIFFVLDYEGRYVDIAPANEQLLYRTPDELIGKTLHEVFPKEMADKFLSLVRTALATGRSTNWDYELEIEGKKFWFYSTTVPFEKNNTMTIVRDITDIKEFEQKLRVSEKRMSIISALTTDYLFATTIDDSGKITTDWIAGAFKKLTGYEVEEYIEQGGWRNTIYPEDIAIDDEAFSKLQRNEDVVCELRTLHKDGHIVWMRSYAHPLWDKDNNKLLSIVGAVKDITEEKKNDLIKDIQYNIAQALVSNKSIQELFKTVRKELSSIINVTNFLIALYDETTGMLKSDIDEDEMDKINEWKAEGSMTGYIVKTGKTLVLSKSDIEELIQKDVIRQVGTLSEQWLGIPLKIQGKSIGAIVVQSYDNPKRYDNTALEILEIVAIQLSLFIERKRFVDQTIKLSKAIEQSLSSVVITDIKGRIEYVNKRFTEITGYSYEEAIGNNPRILNSGVHEKKFYDELWKTLLSGKDWKGEFRNKKKSGELYWEEALISPIINEENEITHFIAIKEDITAKKLLFQEILESESKFRSVWENSLDGMRLLDEDANIVDVNEAYCKLVQMDADQLRGKILNVIYEVRDSSASAIQIFKDKFSRRSVEKNMEIETNLWNGRRIWFEFSNSFIEFPGKKTLLLSVIRDVTDKKLLINDLIEARDKAEEMNKVKSFFFANMSHELRTPLVGILGFSEILKSELSNSPELSRMADLIFSSGQRLHETLNLILSVSKLESGKLDLQLKEVDIIPLLKNSFELFSPIADKKNLEYTISIQRKKIISRIDAGLFQNIINNLINNAIKFTEQGSVSLIVVIVKSKVLIQVSDTGIGIHKDHQAVIWEEFRQSSEGISRNFEGTGLGLTIAKKYTELMGGKISLKSQVNRGSIFTLEFPIMDKTTEPDQTIDKKAIRAKDYSETHPSDINILFVEDDDRAIDLVSIILPVMYSLDVVKDAESALEKVKTKKFNAILMDINLSKGMDGVQLTKLIREFPDYRSTPIIAVTAFAMESEKNEFLSKGFSHYLAKPFKKQELLDLLNDIFTKQ
ncbi:MAG: PAS domain S-box protein [Ignavibacterium sp.]|nr:PAS domain S-box protein [Ignavibacterium sp.]